MNLLTHHQFPFCEFFLYGTQCCKLWLWSDGVFVGFACGWLLNGVGHHEGSIDAGCYEDPPSRRLFDFIIVMVIVATNQLELHQPRAKNPLLTLGSVNAPFKYLYDNKFRKCLSWGISTSSRCRYHCAVLCRMIASYTTSTVPTSFRHIAPNIRQSSIINYS